MFSELVKYGIEVAVIGTLFFIGWRILIWVMAFFKEQTAQHTAERVNWIETQKLERQAWVRTQEGFIQSLNKLDQSIQNHTASSVEARNATAEAHKYQRDEHEKMLEQLNTTCNCLNEVEKSLGRINGYKS